jgi:RHS repeat-associated protein
MPGSAVGPVGLAFGSWAALGQLDPVAHIFEDTTLTRPLDSDRSEGTTDFFAVSPTRIEPTRPDSFSNQARDAASDSRARDPEPNSERRFDRPASVDNDLSSFLPDYLGFDSAASGLPELPTDAAAIPRSEPQSAGGGGSGGGGSDSGSAGAAYENSSSQTQTSASAPLSDSPTIPWSQDPASGESGQAETPIAGTSGDATGTSGGGGGPTSGGFGSGPMPEGGFDLSGPIGVGTDDLIANNDLARTTPETAVTIPVLANDIGVATYDASVASYTTPAHGSLMQDGDILIYTPEAGFTGYDAFNYSIVNSLSQSDTATVAIGVHIPAPVITAITTDSGAANDDALTNDQTLLILGTAVADSAVTIYLDSAPIGATEADENGAWQFDYTETELPEGDHPFIATATSGEMTSLESPVYMVTVDLTPPDVSLMVLNGEVQTLAPTVHVVATDLKGLADGTPVYIDVDLNEDQDFADSGETGYGSGEQANNWADIRLPDLPGVGIYLLRARTDDAAGNEGTSDNVSLEITPVALTLIDVTLEFDPLASNIVSFAIDLDSSACSCTCSTELTYNSSTVDVHPFVQVMLQLGNDGPPPDDVHLELFWDNASQGYIDFSTEGFAPGDVVTVAMQVVDESGIGQHIYRVEATFPETELDPQQVENRTFTIPRDDSALGAGWGLTGIDRLFPVEENGTYPAGVLRVFGDGTSYFYADDGEGNYVSPPGDNGFLEGDEVNGWTYTTPTGEIWTYNADGFQIGWQSADGHESHEVTWDGENIDTFTSHDGTVSTFGYTLGLLTSIVSGERTVTLTQTDGQLTAIENADGSVENLAYNENNYLLSHDTAGTSYHQEWTYQNGLVTGQTTGSGGEAAAYLIQSGSQVGGTAPSRGTAWSRVTDPLGRVTITQSDSKGRVLKRINPDGGVEIYLRDFEGRVTSYRDALGRTTTFERDEFGFVTAITLPNSATIEYEYQTDFHALTQVIDERGIHTLYGIDSEGHVESVTQAYGTADATSTFYTYVDGHVYHVLDDGQNLLHEFTYDNYDRLSTDLDGEGNTRTWNYDLNGFVATYTDGRDITTTFTNDAKGRVLTSTVGENGPTLEWVYDDAGMLTSFTDGNGVIYEQEYDTRGNPTVSTAGSNSSHPIVTETVWNLADEITSAIDPYGEETSFTNNLVGLSVGVEDALGNTAEATVDLAGQTTGVRDGRGNWTTFTLDNMGAPATVIDALGNEWTYARDDAGLVTSLTDPLDNVTLYVYNGLRQLSSSTDADLVEYDYAYDANGLLASVTDSLARVTSYGRDSIGRVTSVTEADGTSLERTSTVILDEEGYVISADDALAQTVTYGFDDFGRQTSAGDEAGNTWAWTYDDNGNVLTSTYNGTTTQYEYDAFNRLVQVTDADGRMTRYVYDDNNNVQRQIDGEGNISSYFYDELGRQFLIVAADFGITEMRYDAAGDLTMLIDPVGNASTWRYDALNRVVSETDPDGQTRSISYDDAGRVSEEIDRLGRKKQYTYTDAGRLASEVWRNAGNTIVETLSYTYYDDGRLHTASNSAGTYTLTYDDLGRVATVQDPNGITLTYGWNEVDNLVSLEDSEGGLVESTYDQASRLIERAQSGTGVESLSVQIDYDTEGRRGELRRYSDATGTTLVSKSDYGYDNAGNLTDEVHKDDAGTPIVTYANTFDDDNRITSETRNSVTTNYQYDVTSQVTDDDTNAYSFDLNGNRTMEGYETGVANRIESDGVWTYSYDLEGNVIKKSMGEEAETWEYGYDHNNRLLWAEKANTDGGQVRLRVEYTYDVFGNRIAQTVEHYSALGVLESSATTKYSFFGQQVWADLDENGDIVTRYLLGDEFGERLARSGDGATFWLLTDRLGSTREILDETGEMVDEISYDGFGNVVSETEPGLSGDYLFGGYRWWEVVSLYGTWTRDYDPLTGRWRQPDFIGFNGGLMNLYGYVGNNGTNATDLSGLVGAQPVNPVDTPEPLRRLPRVRAWSGTIPIASGTVNGTSALDAVGFILAGVTGIGCKPKAQAPVVEQKQVVKPDEEIQIATAVARLRENPRVRDMMDELAKRYNKPYQQLFVFDSRLVRSPGNWDPKNGVINLSPENVRLIVRKPETTPDDFASVVLFELIRANGEIDPRYQELQKDFLAGKYAKEEYRIAEERFAYGYAQLHYQIGLEAHGKCFEGGAKWGDEFLFNEENAKMGVDKFVRSQKEEGHDWAELRWEDRFGKK